MCLIKTVIPSAISPVVIAAMATVGSIAVSRIPVVPGLTPFLITVKIKREIRIL